MLLFMISKKKKIYHKKRIVIKGIGKPEILLKSKEKISEMSIKELIQYYKKLISSDIKNNYLIVDIHSRLSYPLTNLFMVLTGLFLSFKIRSMGWMITASIGIIIALVYWFSFTFCISLGYAKLLSPYIAGWFVPVSSTILGFYLYIKIP